MGFSHNLFSKILVTLALAGCLQACGQLSFLMQGKTARINQMIEQHDYYSALDLIDATPSTAADYESLKPLRQQVLDAIDAYEKQTLRAVDELVKKDLLVQALSLNDEALSHLPASKLLTARKKQIQQAIDRKLQQTELSLAEHRARALPPEISILQTLQKYTDSEEVSTALENRRQEQSRARVILLEEANRALEKKQWSDARRYAELADQLYSDKASKQILARTEANVLNQRLDQLRDAIERDDLLRASTLAAQLKNNSEQAQQLKKDLQQKIQARVASLTREGQQAYTKGDLDLAIQRWELALQLAPDNDDIKNQLKRARAFKQNYQRIKAN